MCNLPSMWGPPLDNSLKIATPLVTMLFQPMTRPKMQFQLASQMCRIYPCF